MRRRRRRPDEDLFSTLRDVENVDGEAVQRAQRAQRGGRFGRRTGSGRKGARTYRDGLPLPVLGALGGVASSSPASTGSWPIPDLYNPEGTDSPTVVACSGILGNNGGWLFDPAASPATIKTFDVGTFDMPDDEPWSFCCWLNATAFVNPGLLIGNEPGVAELQCFTFQTVTSGFAMYVRSSDGTDAYWTSAGSLFSVGTPAHFAYTFNPLTGAGNGWLNGVVRLGGTQPSFVGKTFSGNTRAPSIGAQSSSSAQVQAGCISEVAYWTGYSITDAIATELYNKGLGGDPLVA